MQWRLEARRRPTKARTALCRPWKGATLPCSIHQTGRSLQDGLGNAAEEVSLIVLG